MKKLFCALLALAFFLPLAAQTEASAQDTSWKHLYRETPEKINDLVHTKLEVRFDYDKAYLYGKAWITLAPHFYPTDSLTLDAKGMQINKVTLAGGKPLHYVYDSLKLYINLGKTYKGGEKYTVFIDYVSKPNEYKVKGSAAITDAKGLYFINPKGEEKNKPTQIWTQGETEATSVWCPTIDRPNQKSTQEISMTVPAKYVTLSNGALTSSKKNADGTRTDTWKMDLPHAPYLFFMGVGDFAVIKDKYKNKEVNYYVEHEYASVARKIFGHTPEMIGFFSRILNYEYPWNKFSQMVGRDYVSGAMENTTATLYQEGAQQDARELIDGNTWEGTIAHELFHHWFGDLVTSESWSNLTLNESFANYSQVMWFEYKYGKDAGDEENYSDMGGYLRSESDHKNLVRYYYPDKEAMFDAVSYNKGGRILHMLRNYVGDSAFFKSLHLYLTTNKFKSAEAHQLRMAFEEITGKDLNWFWNQWYFGAGHPVLDINYVYNDEKHEVEVIVNQKQEGAPFILPIAVDIYEGGKKERKQAWLRNRADTLRFSYTRRPDLVNVDADKVLLAEKTDHKTLENYLHQYKYAANYLDRREAIDFAAHQNDPKALDLMKTAIKDKYHGLRTYAISQLNMQDETVRNAVEPILADNAAKDPKSSARSAALSLLATYRDPKYKSLFEKYIHDSSYSVSGSALEGLFAIDSSAALGYAKKLSAYPAKGKLVESITGILISSGDETGFDVISNVFDDMPPSQAKFNLLMPLTEILGKMRDTQKVKTGVDMIVSFRESIPEHYGLSPFIDNLLQRIISQKEAARQTSMAPAVFQEQIDYLRSKLSGK